MADIQAATDMEVMAVAGITVDTTCEPSMPLGVIVFAIVAFVSEALWLGLIGWAAESVLIGVQTAQTCTAR
jgi:hypothetical protein